jgi:putative flippase GtrA
MRAGVDKMAWFARQRAFRYLVNGAFATAVHFGVLVFNMQVLNWSSAGVANGVAAIFGIAASFLGSRYYVFPSSSEAVGAQLLKFLLLYLSIAFLHAGLLFVWADYYQLNYLLGFFVATLLQLLLSYWGNKLLVFKV